MLSPVESKIISLLLERILTPEHKAAGLSLRYEGLGVLMLKDGAQVKTYAGPDQLIVTIRHDADQIIEQAKSGVEVEKV